MRYETLILIFIRAHREKFFPLYVEVLEELTPLFFALDHVNYSRWVPCPHQRYEVLAQHYQVWVWKVSHCVLSKTTKQVLYDPIWPGSRAGEQYCERFGWCLLLGLQKTVAFRRWMLSGPEMARLLNQFEEEYLPDDETEISNSFQHHKQGLSTQKTFQRQITSLSETDSIPKFRQRNIRTKSI